MPNRKRTSDRESGSETDGLRKSVRLKGKPQKDYDKLNRGLDTGKETCSSSEGDRESEGNPVSSEIVSSESSDHDERQSTCSSQHGRQQSSDNEEVSESEAEDEVQINEQLAKKKENMEKMELLES